MSLEIQESVRTRILAKIQHMPKGLQTHIHEVRQVSVDLAHSHCLDANQAELAALGHDICRTTKAHDLIIAARSFGLPVTDIDKAFPLFLHGPVGAEIIQRDYLLKDVDILNSIRYHTMGRKDMSDLEKVMFLADKLDPSKINRYPFIETVYRLAQKNLDEGILCFIDNQMQTFIKQANLIHPGMVAARNDSLLQVKNRQQTPD